MLQPLKSFVIAVLIAALLLAVRRATAQPNIFRGGPERVPVAAAITNGNVTFSWPVLPGRWELMEQQPASTPEWKAVSPGLYHTNDLSVSVTVPVPAKPSLYRLRRVFAFHPPTLPDFPPVPPMPTNRPVPPKFPGHPVHP